MVRRLPVIQSSAPEDSAAEARPSWQWTLIGGGFVLTIWVPLALLALRLGQFSSARFVNPADPEAVVRFQESHGRSGVILLAVLTILPVVLSFALASLAGGALVGRFGGRSGKREATLGGVFAAITSCAIAGAGGALSPWPVAVGAFSVLVAVGACFSRLGATLGLSRRNRAGGAGLGGDSERGH
jgi:hypothetical protein